MNHDEPQTNFSSQLKNGTRYVTTVAYGGHGSFNSFASTAYKLMKHPDEISESNYYSFQPHVFSEGDP